MNKKLTIVMVTNNYTPYSGGLVSSIKATTEQLQAQGHDVFIITLDFLGEKHDDPPFVRRIPSLARFHYKKNHMAISMRPEHYIKKFLQELKPDVVHVHHPFFLGYYAAREAKGLGIPVVFTYHTMYEDYVHYVPLPQFIIKPTVQKLVLAFCAEVDGIIAPSEHIRSYLVQNSIAKKVEVIPSGLLPIFASDSFVAKKRTENGPFKLLCVTRFAKEKNVTMLLDVFVRLSTFHFVRPEGSDSELEGLKNKYTLTLVGYGSEEENLKKYAYEYLQLSPKVIKFLIAPPKAEIAQHYSDADLFLFSSTTDTQGLVLAEAMAAGTPVIAVDGPGQRDIIEQGENGFIVDGVDQMVQKINELIHDQQLHQQFQQAAWRTGNGYCAGKMAQKLISFYKGFKTKD